MSGIPPSPLSYQLDTNHPLTRRDQYYTLDRKLLTVHSDDRDICKWPRSNHFEIELPETMNNVQSMRLVECSLPTNYYTFSNDYQNTRFVFTITENDPEADWRQPPYTAHNWPLLSGPSFEVVIGEGFYCPEELACELEAKMNKAVTEFLRKKAQPQPNTHTYTNFRVHYDKVAQKYYFGNIVDGFQLKFGYRIMYDVQCPLTPNVWEQYTKWGLPSYLGFEKENYNSRPYPTRADSVTGKPDVVLDPSGMTAFWTCCHNPVWLPPKYQPTITPGAPTPNPTGQYDVSGVVQFVEAPLTMKILGERVIYMEVDKYNNYVELDPYSKSTNSMYNNDYRGRNNSAFAKIPITTLPYGETFDSRNGFLQNIVTFEPPIERISRLKFTFRYHDGRLVDFQDFPFNFTIAFNRIQNEIPRQYCIRVPPTFIL
jgi:hypothetical protein